MVELRKSTYEVTDFTELRKLFHYKICLNLLKRLCEVPPNKCERNMSCQVVATPIALV